MNGRWAATAVLVLSLMVAGCGGQAPTASPSVSATPSPIPPSATVALRPSATHRPRPTPLATPKPRGTVYVVKQGDTLYAIAVRYKVTLAAILAANPQITNPTQLAVGQKILIPAH